MDKITYQKIDEFNAILVNDREISKKETDNTFKQIYDELYLTKENKKQWTNELNRRM